MNREQARIGCGSVVDIRMNLLVASDEKCKLAQFYMRKFFFSTQSRLCFFLKFHEMDGFPQNAATYYG